MKLRSHLNFGKQAFILSLAIITASIVNYLYGFSHTFWLVLVTFLIVHSVYGMPWRHVLIILLLIVTALIFSHFLYAYLNIFNVPLVAIISIFIIAALINYQRGPHLEYSLSFVLLFPLSLLLTTLTPALSNLQLFDQIIDVVIGAAIGFVFARFVFPFQPVTAFSKELVPILDRIIDYANAEAEYIANFNTQNNLITACRTKLNEMFTSKTLYPGWVFQAGFNPGLRGGYRFFLIKLDQLIELLNVIDNQLQTNLPELEVEMREAFITSIKSNIQLLTVLKEYFLEKKVHIPQEDFTSDIVQLEKILQPMMPANLELLDVSTSIASLVAIVRAVKDIRQLLLQLVMALPTTGTSIA